MADATDPTATLAGIRAEVRVSCLGHNALRLLAALDAVLKLTRDSAGTDRHHARVLTVGEVREAITRELTGKEAGDGR